MIRGSLSMPGVHGSPKADVTVGQTMLSKSALNWLGQLLAYGDPLSTKK